MNLLGPGPRLTKKKKNLPGRGLTNVEKHWCRGLWLHLNTLNDTHTHTYTLERPPMDERAVRRRDRKPHNTQKRHILAPEGIRTAIPASKRQQIHVLDRVINGSGDRECIYYTRSIKYVSVFSNTQQCYTKRQVNPSFIY